MLSSTRKPGCYKHLLLFIICFLGSSLSAFAVLPDSWMFTEKELDICVCNFNKNTDTYAYILTWEQIGEDSLFICIYSDICLFFYEECNQKIQKSLLKNQFMINNHSIPLKAEMHNIYLSGLHPQRIILMQNVNQKYYIVECF